MIRVMSMQRTVWRSEFRGPGRHSVRSRLTRRLAYLDAAWAAWCARYPCECEPEVGFVCVEHRMRHVMTHDGGQELDTRAVYRDRVVKRLARWLMWRDRVFCAEHADCRESPTTIGRACAAARRRSAA